MKTSLDSCRLWNRFRIVVNGVQMYPRLKIKIILSTRMTSCFAMLVGSGRPLAWGRALGSVAMSKRPTDWITGDTLNPNKIRELERDGDLDRHHVFSRDSLKRAGVPLDRIQNGLNGVFLDERQIGDWRKRHLRSI